jgi:hypothetical protein
MARRQPSRRHGRHPANQREERMPQDYEPKELNVHDELLDLVYWYVGWSFLAFSVAGCTWIWAIVILWIAERCGL